jgi:hypothetical protein
MHYLDDRLQFASPAVEARLTLWEKDTEGYRVEKSYVRIDCRQPAWIIMSSS